MMTINLLQELRVAPVKSVRGVGPCILFSDFYQQLQVRYGLDNHDLLTSWLEQLERDGSIRLYRPDGLLVGVFPVS